MLRGVGDLRLDGGVVDTEAQAFGVVAHLHLNAPSAERQQAGSRAAQRLRTRERVAFPGTDVGTGLRPGEAAVRLLCGRVSLETVDQHATFTPLRLIGHRAGTGDFGIGTHHEQPALASRHRNAQVAALQVGPGRTVVEPRRHRCDHLGLQRTVRHRQRRHAHRSRSRHGTLGNLHVLLRTRVLERLGLGLFHGDSAVVLVRYG